MSIFLVVYKIGVSEDIMKPCLKKKKSNGTSYIPKLEDGSNSPEHITRVKQTKVYLMLSPTNLFICTVTLSAIQPGGNV